MAILRGGGIIFSRTRVFFGRGGVEARSFSQNNW